MDLMFNWLFNCSKNETLYIQELIKDIEKTINNNTEEDLKGL